MTPSVPSREEQAERASGDVASDARPRLRQRALLLGLVASGALFGVVALASRYLLPLAELARPARPAEPSTPPAEQPTAIAEPAQPAAPAPAAEPQPLPGSAPAPAPAPAPLPTSAHGKLVLRVKPWAEVYEGDTSLGITPMPPLELAAGTHKLTLKNPDLGVSRSVSVKVPKNGTVTLKVDLKR